MQALEKRPDVYENIATMSLESCLELIGEHAVAARMVIDRVPTCGPTERFEKECARRALDRILQIAKERA